MLFKRTESEVRELHAALNALLSHLGRCRCKECAQQAAVAVGIIDVLSWLLGERGTELFYLTHGEDADLDFHYIHTIITDHKLGVFTHKGTG